MLPKMIFWQFCILVLCCIATTKGMAARDNVLHNPDDPLKCVHRPKQWQWAPSNRGERPHHYFYSRDVPEFKDYKYDWLTARNLCRNHCMDAVAIETEAENNMVFDFIKNHDIYDHVGPTWLNSGQCGRSSPLKDGTFSQCDSISDFPCCGQNGFCVQKNDISCNCHNCIDYTRNVDYLWTSGRICDFEGCENRPDLRPLIVRGWFWSNNHKTIPDTDQTNWSYQPWSHTGNFHSPQPDNAEFFINQTPESCLGILNNLYDDGVKWHDIACYHKKPVLCEDDEDLLRHMQRNYPQHNY